MWDSQTCSCLSDSGVATKSKPPQASFHKFGARGQEQSISGGAATQGRGVPRHGMCIFPRYLHWEREWLGHMASLNLTHVSLCRNGLQPRAVSHLPVTPQTFTEHHCVPSPVSCQPLGETRKYLAVWRVALPQRCVHSAGGLQREGSRSLPRSRDIGPELPIRKHI